MSADETEALVKHYLGFPYPQTGPGAKPVPPVLFCISKDSRDHSPEVYREVVLPMFATLDPAPKVRVRAMGRGRAHLSQVRARPAARHRAAGGGVLRAGDPGGVFPGIPEQKIAHQLVEMRDRVQRNAQAGALAPGKPIGYDRVGRRNALPDIVELLRQDQIDKDRMRLLEHVEIALARRVRAP